MNGFLQVWWLLWMSSSSKETRGVFGAKARPTGIFQAQKTTKADILNPECPLNTECQRLECEEISQKTGKK